MELVEFKKKYSIIEIVDMIQKMKLDITGLTNFDKLDYCDSEEYDVPEFTDGDRNYCYIINNETNEATEWIEKECIAEYIADMQG